MYCEQVPITCACKENIEKLAGQKQVECFENCDNDNCEYEYGSEQLHSSNEMM